MEVLLSPESESELAVEAVKPGVTISSGLISASGVLSPAKNEEVVVSSSPWR